MSKPNKFAALAEQGLKETAEQPAPAPTPTPAPASAEPPRMLGGRVPAQIFEEFSYAKLAAERATRLRRVTTEEGIDAMVRMLREPEILERWHELLKEVRQEKRG